MDWMSAWARLCMGLTAVSLAYCLTPPGSGFLARQWGTRSPFLARLCPQERNRETKEQGPREESHGFRG